VQNYSHAKHFASITSSGVKSAQQNSAGDNNCTAVGERTSKWLWVGQAARNFLLWRQRGKAGKKLHHQVSNANCGINEVDLQFEHLPPVKTFMPHFLQISGFLENLAKGIFPEIPVRMFP